MPVAGKFIVLYNAARHADNASLSHHMRDVSIYRYDEIDARLRSKMRRRFLDTSLTPLSAFRRRYARPKSRDTPMRHMPITPRRDGVEAPKWPRIAVIIVGRRYRRHMSAIIRTASPPPIFLSLLTSYDRARKAFCLLMASEYRASYTRQLVTRLMRRAVADVKPVLTGTKAAVSRH